MPEASELPEAVVHEEYELPEVAVPEVSELRRWCLRWWCLRHLTCGRLMRLGKKRWGWRDWLCRLNLKFNGLSLWRNVCARLMWRTRKVAHRAWLDLDRVNIERNVTSSGYTWDNRNKLFKCDRGLSIDLHCGTF